MTPNIDDPSGDPRAPESPSAIRDRRVKPRGVLPRHVQMWLMIAIALIILIIILLTGQPEPAPRSQSGPRPAQPALVPPERVRSFEQQLAAEAARQQQTAEQQAAAIARGAGRTTGTTTSSGSADPFADEQRRREYQSLFADNVALSRRPSDRQPFADPGRQNPPPSNTPAIAQTDIGLLEQLLARNLRGPAPTQAERSQPGAIPTPPVVTAETPKQEPEATQTPSPPKDTAPIAAGGGVQRLLEGTVIETVLLNRLDGTFAGPVTCLVTTPVYSHDRQSVVIPAGARVLGSSSPVQTWGDSRLAVSFHRLVMPDGRTHSLDRFKGLSQIGDTGLKDSVNRHYLQVFGASLAIGALSGLAQYGSRSGFDSYSFGDSYRQAAGSSLAASTGRVLDRYLNVLPTITIREGYRIKVYLTNDLMLPVYATVSGGVR